MTKFEPSVEIVEYYKDYEPSIDATMIAGKLIDNIPSKYLLGLGKIVITNLSGLSQRELRKKTKSRKRKVDMNNVIGLYHYPTGNSPAWIEIFVDQMSYFEIGFFRKIPFLRELFFSKTLYHEVGHHIHTVVRPEHSREREDIADEWQVKLTQYYIRKKYWYLLPLLWLFLKITQTKAYKRYDERVMADIKERYKE